MISEGFQQIDTLIGKGKSFALYRLPKKDEIVCVMQENGSATLLYDLEELNGRRGFVIAPFHITEETPLILISPERVERAVSTSINNISPFSFILENQEERKAGYAARFDAFFRAVKKKRFRKLVLSRSMDIVREKNFSPVRTFLTACRTFPDSYVFLVNTPGSGTWLGSTPEMLLCGKQHSWSTVAIAGTQPMRARGELPEKWNRKNRAEQQLVADYIRSQLKTFGVNPVMQKPYTVQAGNVAHLRSDCNFELPDYSRMGSLLKSLHPTPAVSGLPKEESIRFILDNEGYDRRYYTGFVGMFDPEAVSTLYVNLRCMRIGNTALTLYAGGGLLPASVLDDEWQETENKLQSMLTLLKIV